MNPGPEHFREAFVERSTLLEDIVYGNITVSPGYPKDEIVEITVEAIEEEYDRFRESPDQRTAGVRLIRLIDQILGWQDTFDEAGIKWIQDVKVLVGVDTFNITPSDLALVSLRTPTPHDEDPSQYHQRY